MPLARPVTLLVADKVVRSGTEIDRHRNDAMLQGIRAFNDSD